MRSDKQASLSSALLAGKKAAALAEETAAAVPALRIVPDPSPSDAAATDAAPDAGPTNEAAVAEAEAGAPETLLFSKGSASAAGFRPSYWSYDRPPAEAEAEVEAPEPETDTAETPPAILPPPPAEATPVTRPAAGMGRRGQWAVIGFGCAALLVSAISLFGLGSHRSPSPDTAPATVPAAAPQSAVSPVAAALPVPSAVPVAAAPAAPAPAARAADAAAIAERQEIEALLARGNALLDTGDIISARLFFERIADRDARAALLLAQTYDPTYLHRIGVLGVRGDPAKAVIWYQRARDLDSGAGALPRAAAAR